MILTSFNICNYKIEKLHNVAPITVCTLNKIDKQIWSPAPNSGKKHIWKFPSLIRIKDSNEPTHMAKPYLDYQETNHLNTQEDSKALPCNGEWEHMWELTNIQRRQAEVIISSMWINHNYLMTFWLSQKKFLQISKDVAFCRNCPWSLLTTSL